MSGDQVISSEKQEISDESDFLSGKIDDDIPEGGLDKSGPSESFFNFLTDLSRTFGYMDSSFF